MGFRPLLQDRSGPGPLLRSGVVRPMGPTCCRVPVRFEVISYQLQGEHGSSCWANRSKRYNTFLVSSFWRECLNKSICKNEVDNGNASIAVLPPSFMKASHTHSNMSIWLRPQEQHKIFPAVVNSFLNQPGKIQHILKQLEEHCSHSPL